MILCACGAERQAGQSCRECGRDPEEVDSDIERRRAIVRGVGDRESVADVVPLHADEAFSALHSWFGSFSAAYEATADGELEDATTRLRNAVVQLDQLHARAASAR